ncbi:MAG: type IV pilin [Haloferacaceae archaeon]
MRVGRLLTEDRAVAPVIAVILLVAIVVVLAAVIGTYVLGVGESVDAAPQAKFTFDAVPAATGTGQDVTVTHFGGESFTEDNTNELRVRTAATSARWALPVDSGDERVVRNVANGTEVRVVWSSPTNETSTVVATGQVPG